MSRPFKTSAEEYAYWFSLLAGAFARVVELEKAEDRRRHQDLLDVFDKAKDKERE